MTRVLEVHDLEKNFGGVVAAHNINVAVEIGETIGIIGAERRWQDDFRQHGDRLSETVQRSD